MILDYNLNDIVILKKKSFSQTVAFCKQLYPDLNAGIICFDKLHLHFPFLINFLLISCLQMCQNSFRDLNIPYQDLTRSSLGCLQV